MLWVSWYCYVVLLNYEYSLSFVLRRFLFIHCSFLIYDTRGGNSRGGVPIPASVPQKMFSFDNNVAPNTDFGETSIFGNGNQSSKIYGGAK
jgi:hypothetical protein